MIIFIDYYDIIIFNVYYDIFLESSVLLVS